MTYGGLIGILPILVLALAGVALMLVAAFRRSHALAAGLSLSGFLLAVVALLATARVAPQARIGIGVTPLLIVDDYALFFTGLLLAAAMVVTVLSYDYLRHGSGRAGGHPVDRNPAGENAYEEFYVLLVLATMGGAVLVASNHFVSFFLGLEVLSVALYGMIAYQRTSEAGIEAGLKYLILASVSSAFLLFGMALVYAALGSMAFDRLGPALRVLQPAAALLAVAGLAITVVGVGFKLAVAPFHMWTPDIYQGAPAPVSAYVATVSKGAVFALLLRYLHSVDLSQLRPLLVGLTAIAVASMFAGNLLALLQRNVKRLLAYSSIAHLGYLLVVLVATEPVRATAAAFYLVAYFAAMLSAFGIVSLLSRPGQEEGVLDHYQGLFWRRPWAAAILVVSLFSLVGIPLTAGFLGKLYILTAGVGSARWLLALSLVVSSVIGLYYYLRVIVAMFLQPAAEERSQGHRKPTMLERIALTGLGLAVLGLGIYPTPLLDTIGRLLSGFIGRLP